MRIFDVGCGSWIMKDHGIYCFPVAGEDDDGEEEEENDDE